MKLLHQELPVKVIISIVLRNYVKTAVSICLKKLKSISAIAPMIANIIMSFVTVTQLFFINLNSQITERCTINTLFETLKELMGNLFQTLLQ